MNQLHIFLAELHSIQLNIIIQLIMGINNVIFSVNSKCTIGLNKLFDRCYHTTTSNAT